MKLLDWIGSNPDAAIGIVTAVVGWLWHKARGEKTQDLWETLQDLALHELPSLLNDPNVQQNAREVITKSVWTGLNRLGIKKSATVDKLVPEVVEWGMARLAEQLCKRYFDALTPALDKANATLKAMPADKPIDTDPEPGPAAA